MAHMSGRDSPTFMGSPFPCVPQGISQSKLDAVGHEVVEKDTVGQALGGRFSFLFFVFIFIFVLQHTLPSEVMYTTTKLSQSHRN